MAERLIGAVIQLIGAVIQLIGRVIQLIGRVIQLIGRVIQLIGRVIQLIGAVIQLIGAVIQLIGRVIQLIGAMDRPSGQRDLLIVPIRWPNDGAVASSRPDTAPMNEQLQVLGDIARRLDGAEVPYMLTGSMALSFYAQPRFTRAVDLVVQLGYPDAARFVSLFAADFDCDPDMVQEAIRYQKMFNVIHYASVLKFDFVICKSTPYRQEELARRRRMSLDGVEIAVVAPEDLLLSKLLWGRDSQSEMQRRDVVSLIESQTPLDWDYLEKWAKELGILGELMKVNP